MGNDSGVEIKVINPRRGDNVVHPVGAGRAASLPVADDDRRRQQGNGERPQRRRQQVRGMILEHSKQYRPWMVPGFVVVNIVVFTITMYVNDCPKNTDSCVAKFLGRLSFQPLKENPLLGPSSSTLVNLGALDVSKVVQRQQGWRLITCIWLHAGVFHILANMLSLVFIGIRLEREFGFLKIGFVYLVSGFGGSLMSSLFIQTNISVGASGALFGLLGSMLSELLTNWTIYENKFAALLTLIFIVLLNLAMGILPHVDNFAHIGGFLSGFLLGFVFLVRPQYGYVNKKHIPPGFITASPKPKYKTYQYILWIISLILLIVGFIVGTVLLLRGINLNDRCSWCHYLSCVPTKFWSCKQNVATCETSQLGNQLNITCTSNGKSDIYTLSNESSSRISELCTELCS